MMYDEEQDGRGDVFSLARVARSVSREELAEMLRGMAPYMRSAHRDAHLERTVVATPNGSQEWLKPWLKPWRLQGVQGPPPSLPYAARRCLCLGSLRGLEAPMDILRLWRLEHVQSPTSTTTASTASSEPADRLKEVTVRHDARGA